jgi:hypothetical protein
VAGEKTSFAVICFAFADSSCYILSKKVISGARNKSTITRTTDFGRSPISDIFGGKLRLRVHREGDHSSDNIEPFFTLKLVIEVRWLLIPLCWILNI